MVKPSDLSDQDFLYGYMTEYLDGELSLELQERFQKLIGVQQNAELPERFQKVRGALQLGLQSFYLRESEKIHLRALVQDQTVRETQEARKIDEVGRREVVSRVSRWTAVLALLVIVGGILYYVFRSPAREKFVPVVNLSYEAMAMIEDPEGRLLFPSTSIEEITKYLNASRNLGFSPLVLKSFSQSWVPEGATIIDYEVAKIAVVEYKNTESKEKLFHFAFKGTLSDLPKAEPGNYRGLIYQTYSSDKINIIAWQHKKDVISFLVGRRSAPELATLARMGTGG